MKKFSVLMIGPARDVCGGISTVVNSYYELGLHKECNIKYIATMVDGCKLKKLFTAVKAYILFCLCLKNYDIVHVHMAAQASFTRKSYFIKKAKKAGKKIIIHQHSADFDYFYFKQSSAKKRENIKYIFSLADKVITLSEEWSSFFGRNICGYSKIVTMYNGVILPEYHKEDYSGCDVLFLGRLGRRKGTYDLLKAIPEILKAVPDAMFYLGGDGDIKKCMDIAERNGFKDHVNFLGWVRGHEKEEYLKKCSIFVLPSYSEGMPMSLLEAMSYGLASVSTNAGGIPQIIDSGVNGLRFEAGDVNALSLDIIDLLRDRDKRQWLGEEGQRTVAAKFNVENNIKQLVNLYRRMGEICYDCN